MLLSDSITSKKNNTPLLKKDVAAKNYIGRNEVFATIMNYMLFNGENVIKPESLESIDTASLFKGSDTDTQRYRDLLKEAIIKYDKDAYYTILGIENQNLIDLTMPLRIACYDIASYDKQLTELKRKHKDNNDLHSRVERMSRIAYGDKLKPVYTVVVYFGREEWKQPLSLLDMCDISPSVKPLLNDWKMPLLDIGRLTIESYKKFTSDVGLIFKSLSNNTKTDATTARELIAGYKKGKLSDEGMQLLRAYFGIDIVAMSEKGVLSMDYTEEDAKIGRHLGRSIVEVVKEELDAKYADEIAKYRLQADTIRQQEEKVRQQEEKVRQQEEKVRQQKEEIARLKEQLEQLKSSNN